MYHISNDKRAHRSAALICQGLAEKLQKKPYPEISITDVCAPGGVARTTFYRLFDTLDDVLLYQFDVLFEESLRQYSAGGSYAKIMLQSAMKDPALTAAIISSGRNDLFDFSTRTREGELLKALRLELSETDRQYCTPMLNQMAYAILRTWVRNGCKETADALYEIMKREIKVIADNL